METPGNTTTSLESELVQRHHATARTVKALVIAVVLLCVLAFVSKKFLTEQTNPSLHMAVLIAILVLGLSAIAFRRTRFATMRLQDIAALRGASGLLITLQRTTLQIALLGVTAAAIGFVATLLTGDDFYTYRAGLIAVAVLLYCYPIRSSWEKAVRRFSPDQNGPDLPEDHS